jgi:hypothetical protein
MVFGPGGKPATATAADTLGPDDFEALSLDDFTVSTALAPRDEVSLTVLAEYLRHFVGEKHLVFVTENGLPLPAEENDRALAALANEGRTAIQAGAEERHAVCRAVPADSRHGERPVRRLRLRFGPGRAGGPGTVVLTAGRQWLDVTGEDRPRASGTLPTGGRRGMATSGGGSSDLRRALSSWAASPQLLLTSKPLVERSPAPPRVPRCDTAPQFERLGGPIRSRHAANHSLTQLGDRARYPGPNTLSVKPADRSCSACSRRERARSVSAMAA